MKIGRPKRNTFYKYLSKARNFLYFSIIRRFLYYSRLGRRSMFGYADTGANFDYIYLAEPKGYNTFGKFVDLILLHLPSAKATRERRKIFTDLIKKEIVENKKNGNKTRIVDLASGQARYILDALHEIGHDLVEVLALDLDPVPLQRGSIACVGSPILFKKADILKLDRLCRFSKKKKWIPNIFTLSGMYEYLNDEDMQKSLSDLYRYLDVGGVIIFSWQLRNPNKTLLSKLGKTRSGKKWVLHYRSVKTVSKWMHSFNYTQLEFKKDYFNMYCVCLARKNEK